MDTIVQSSPSEEISQHQLDNPQSPQSSKKLNWKAFFIGIIVVVIIEVIAFHTLNSGNRVASPKPVPTISQYANSSTANWKTYTNQKGGYSITLPSNWEVDMTNDEIEATPPNEAALP